MVERRSPVPGSEPNRVLALLERYIAERLRGNAPAPEELCQDSPELQPALESCIREYEELRGGLAPSARSPDSIAATEDLPEGLLVPGLILGDRYQIRTRLGRGGMGEVWRAFDVKLRVEVALKALLPDRFRDERRRQLLRREVRAAREVVSPNVCRIFDLIEVDGVELVSMEYVDGETLLEHLSEHSPLDLKKAQEIASQFLAGLEAIHQAGLVHRDVKPENIMLTRSGRVVLMDFGLARGTESGAGTVSGTPAYMAPEQAAGLKVDGRADLYSAGVVLAEMVSPGGIRDLESRQSVWEGIRQEPVRVAESPWSRVLEKALAKQPNQRYDSAHALNRALEDITLRVRSADDLTPYPGLASFTEADAEYFFGREAEVEAVWRKLDRPHLVGIVGPSGAGKTSFLRAGLIPNAGNGWAIASFNPGSTAFRSLGQELASELAGDAEALRELVDVEDLDSTVSAVSRWRRRHEQALLIVDQFEELFTLNAGDVQSRFAELLGRLLLEADVFVLLSMRDDFFFHCHEHEALRPVVADLTLLGPPVGAALRRALVQPAMKCGYRFEDDELVDEMLAEVEGERGALPVVAFSMASLWQRRDREQGLITREAYLDIGGVGGALARHAETTLERIGSDHIPIVRELFRNLVTAEGTRAVCERDELLSVFDGSSRDTPDEVLRELVDARLLTSYEVHGDDEEPTRRVEIIHESLLTNWPRLERWQTQDADAAQLRDELRQASRTWDEHDRSDDRLWTGSAYREFELWRERYPGGLSDIEEDFSSAMTSFANRKRRRRRVAVATMLVMAAIVTAVMTVLWRQSVLQERRAEAQKLVALGQVQLEKYPTAALAHAAKSLELADSEEARFLAMEALWQGPTAIVVNEDPTNVTSFSPGGKWLVQSLDFMSSLRLISRDGREQVLEHPAKSSRLRVAARFHDAEDIFTSNVALSDDALRIALWSAPEGRLLASARPLENPDSYVGSATDGAAETARAVHAMGQGELVIVEALYADGRHERLAELRLTVPPGDGAAYCLDPASGAWLAVVDRHEVSVYRISSDGLSVPRLLGRQEGDVARCMADRRGRFFLTVTSAGEIRRWDPAAELTAVDFELPPGVRPSRLSLDGSYLYARSEADEAPAFSIWAIGESDLRLVRRFEEVPPDFRALEPVGLWLAMRGPMPAHRLWSLTWPAGAEPISLRHGPVSMAMNPMFSPDGRWLATSDRSGLTLWPLGRPYPAVLRLDSLRQWSWGLAFGPDGRFLVTAAGPEVRLWPLSGPVPPAGHVVFEVAASLKRLAVSPDGELFAVGADGGVPSNELWIGRDGEEPLAWSGDEELRPNVGLPTFSPDGRLVAAVEGGWNPPTAAFHVWEVATRVKVAVFRLEGEEFTTGSSFAGDGRLVTGTTKGVVAWNVESGEHEVLVDGRVGRFVASDDGRRLLLTKEEPDGGWEDPAGSPVFFDLDTGDVTALDTHGEYVRALALDTKGTVAVTGDASGVIRVGPVTGEEPHLLIGHEAEILGLAIDPLGRWIASASIDKTVRLWPMPDLSKPPLHTLPRQELIAKLKTLTNVRVARDPQSATGWTLTHDPFPGWETVPTW